MRKREASEATRREFLEASAGAAGAIGLGRMPSIASASPGRQRSEAHSIRARPVSLDRVRLTGGPLKHAQDLTAAYLLSLDPDRMLAFYRVRAGLPKVAEPYGGWDGPGRNLTGHIAGHHLSAVSLMYRARGDLRFKARADYLVQGLKTVQDAHRDGYLSALEHGREAFAALSRGEIKSAAFDLNGLWSPWYVLHKTFAGLRDAYRHTGNHLALRVEERFAEWAERTLAPLDDSQVQWMLNTEHGGMNEILADLYADTGNRRWLDLSLRFEHHAFTDALKRHQDNLSGKHGNCQIPKLIGSAARYGQTGDADDYAAASFFWDRVAQHHSYVTGGHGVAEYFGPPDVFGARVDGRTCETCNVYNMLKLTRTMFAYRPDAIYADFHERALFNHILASIDPNDGRVSYMVPVGRAVQQEYQDPFEDFTCCCGTGMESHALHGHGVYYESHDTVWINQFVPSTARLDLAHATLEMSTGFPDGGDAKIVLTLPGAREFTVAVRRPVWAGDAFAIRVNGTPLPQPTLASMQARGAGGRAGAPGNEAEMRQVSTYVNVRRIWKSGDVIELELPKSLHLESTPDLKQVAALMWGPLALALDLGPRHEGRGSVPAAPTVVVDRPVEQAIVPGPEAGDFVARGRFPGGSTGVDVRLAPFWRTHRRTYGIYFDWVAG